MTAKFVARLRLTGLGAFRDQVYLVRFLARSEALECTLAVDVLDTNSGPSFVGKFATALARVGLEAQRKATGKPAPRGGEVECNPGQVEREIQTNQQTTAFVDGAVELG